MENKKTVYIAMSADVIHSGHINVIEEGAKYGDVMIGLLTDEAIATYKRLPILDYETREKIFKKKYLAVVDGKIESKEGILEDYLYKDERNNISKVVNKNKKNAKLAKLQYEVLTYNEIKNLSLLKINLFTGRHHQIRVQLANFGHSIFGDQKYGTRGKGKQIALWAYELTIKHPITGEEMTFKDLPDAKGTWCILKE